MRVEECLNEELTEEYNGGYAPVFKAECCGRTVAVKAVWHMFQSGTLILPHSPGVYTDHGISERGCYMETPLTPEHPTITRCRFRTASA